MEASTQRVYREQQQHQEEVCYRTPATVCANIHHLQSPTLPQHHQRGFFNSADNELHSANVCF